MKINKREKLIVPFFKVKPGRVIQNSEGTVFMKLAEECVSGNVVDLSNGYIAFMEGSASVEILDASLEIK